jgi:thiamine biosynthesis protein ThiS
MAESLKIRVNGIERTVAAGTTVAALLSHLTVTLARVAVERNKDLVPRQLFDRTILADGDALEIVQFVGGG